MKINKKKLCIVLGCCIFLSIAMGWSIYKNKTFGRNTLIKSLYNESENGEKIDEQFLKSYNSINLNKLSQGKHIYAEDYFLIAYEYCFVDNNWEEGLKYTKDFKSKKNMFTDRYIELYDDYLINYYYANIKRDNSIIEKLDESFKNVMVNDWNNYSGLLDSELSLSAEFDDYEYMSKKIEDVLENEDDINLEVLVWLKDKLSSIYTQKGYHYARVLELCVEIDSVLNDFDIPDEGYYKARALYNEAVICSLLNADDKAKELYNQALNVNTEYKQLDINIKVVSLNRLITLYVEDGDLDTVKDLLNEYKDVYDRSDDYKQDVLYCLSMGQYYMAKYEKQGFNKDDLSKAEYYLKASRENSSEYLGKTIVNLTTYQSMYSLYLEYLKGNVDYSLNKYKDLLETVKNITMKRLILNKMYIIYHEQGMFEEAIRCYEEIADIKDKECLLINKDYSDYHIEKYRSDIKIRKLNEMKFKNYINWIILILTVGTIVVIVLLKNKRLRRKNLIDGMTQINNRAYFDKLYNRKLERGKDFYLYIFDIDNFKMVNDTYGHLIGDQVLTKVAEVGKEIVKDKGGIFRYGGEEFVVLVCVRDKTIVMNMAEEIRKKIEGLTWDNGMNITISMGVADSAVEKENVLKVADNRLYISKTTGKNKVTFEGGY